METAVQKTPADFLLKTKKHHVSTPLELEIAQVFHDIVDSSTSADARAAISNIKIMRVKEVDVEETGKKAIVIVIPYTPFKLYVKPNHARCLTELEKKTKRHVVLIAHRTIMKKNTKRPGLRIRPRSRTLTSVQDAMLEDIVGPTEIVGKRLRVKSDGSQQHKIFLDPKERNKDNLEEKLSTFSAVYSALTSKKAVFDFPEYVL